MKKNKIKMLGMTINILVIIFPAKTVAIGSIFFTNSNIQVAYDISANEIAIRDILIIARSVMNADNEMPSYNAFQWLIDLPAAEDSPNRILSPEETLALQHKMSCSQPGEYSLSFHTLCAYGDNSGVFTTSPPISITILPSKEIDFGEPDIPENIFISRAYPNPSISRL